VKKGGLSSTVQDRTTRNTSLHPRVGQGEKRGEVHSRIGGSGKRKKIGYQGGGGGRFGKGKKTGENQKLRQNRIRLNSKRSGGEEFYPKHRGVLWTKKKESRTDPHFLGGKKGTRMETWPPGEKKKKQKERGNNVREKESRTLVETLGLNDTLTQHRTNKGSSREKKTLEINGGTLLLSRPARGRKEKVREEHQGKKPGHLLTRQRHYRGRKGAKKPVSWGGNGIKSYR